MKEQTMKTTDSGAVRVLLLDDDPMFGSLMTAAARRHGIELDYYPSLLDLGFIGRIEDYTAAIVDYDLGQMTGLEIGKYLSAFLKDTPMVLISASERRRDAKEWDDCIRSFVRKDKGHDAILGAVKAVLDGLEQDRLGYPMAI
jgi:DNA-binding response OmpR family regulator